MTKRVVKAQRSHPGAGRARTWAVSSTVGVQATGSRALNAVGGKASVARIEPEGVDRLVVAQPEPAAHAGLATRRTVGEAGVVGMEAQVDLAHERRRERIGRLHRDALIGRREIGRRRVDQLGTDRRRHVPERAEHLEEPLPPGFEGAGRRREHAAALDDLGAHAGGSGLSRGEVVAGDGHRIGASGRLPHGTHRDAQEVAAVGVAADVPARSDLGAVPAVAVRVDRRGARESHGGRGYRS